MASTDMGSLLSGVGAVLGGLGGAAALFAVIRPPGPRLLNRTAREWAVGAAVAFAFIAFALALIVIYEGWSPNTGLPAVARYGADACGLLAAITGSLIVLSAQPDDEDKKHKRDRKERDGRIGGTALFTGVAVLVAMFLVG